MPLCSDCRDEAEFTFQTNAKDDEPKTCDRCGKGI